MVIPRRPRSPRGAFARGATLIEILVTLVLISLGLLGVAGLMMKLQTSDVEAYQRSQALILLNDMASRMSANRAALPSYVTAAPGPNGVGVGAACPGAGSSTQSRDINAWCQALQGAGEIAGGVNAGAMIGGRGCISDLGNRTYAITVTWQGLTPLAGNNTLETCGTGLYDDGATCQGDACRRSVRTLVRAGNLNVSP